MSMNDMLHLKLKVQYLFRVITSVLYSEITLVNVQPWTGIISLALFLIGVNNSSCRAETMASMHTDI